VARHRSVEYLMQAARDEAAEPRRLRLHGRRGSGRARDLGPGDRGICVLRFPAWSLGGDPRIAARDAGRPLVEQPALPSAVDVIAVGAERPLADIGGEPPTAGGGARRDVVEPALRLGKVTEPGAVGRVRAHPIPDRE
jgi:hypothetical protein